MTKNEFIQQALIQVGAALVKCYDETSDGIINNPRAQQELASTAMNIAIGLFEEAEVKGWWVSPSRLH